MRREVDVIGMGRAQGSGRQVQESSVRQNRGSGSRPRNGQAPARRRISREEYLEIQRQKKRKAMRRRRMQRLKLASMLMLTAVLLVVLVRLMADSGVIALPKWEFLENFRREAELAEVYQNAEAYPEALLEALEKNPELEEFVKGYPDSDGSVTGGITGEELSVDFPLLLQYDKRWGYAAFGDDNIALSGCAPTCLSMVVTALKDTGEAPPNVVADFCEKQGYYQPGVGTSWSLMTEGCLEFGVRGQELGLDKNVIFARLEEGEPIICSMRPGDFTTTGHFIVLTGVEEGKLRVNDPFSRERSGMLWDFEKIQYQIKNLWAFTVS